MRSCSDLGDWNKLFMIGIMKYGAGVQEDQKFDNMNLRSYLVIRQYLLTTTTTTKIVILCCNGDFVRKR